MMKTINFGKIAYLNPARKANLVTVDVKLEDDREGRPVFTASAEVWNTTKTDILMGGQCLDDIWEEFGNTLQADKAYTFHKILRLWKKWHLNDMNAGCVHQRKLGWNDYDKHPSEPCPTCGYKYGSAWVYQEIAPNDLKEIKELLA